MVEDFIKYFSIYIRVFLVMIARRVFNLKNILRLRPDSSSKKECVKERSALESLIRTNHYNNVMQSK